jgi:2-methylcitrate dehydratase
MAQKGLTGPGSIIEALNHTIGHDADLTPLLKGGEKFKILESSMKPYAAAGMMQPSLTMLFPMVKEHSIRPEEVAEINLRTYAFATHASEPQAYKPETRETADHSLPYCLAIALLEGELGPDQFQGEKWKDPKVLDLMAKVKVTADPEMTKVYPSKLQAEFEIINRKGESFKSRVDYPKGDPRNPMTDTEIEAKFRMLASRLIGEKQIAQIIDTVNHIENVKDIGELMKLLVVQQSLCGMEPNPQNTM